MPSDTASLSQSQPLHPIRAELLAMRSQVQGMMRPGMPDGRPPEPMDRAEMGMLLDRLVVLVSAIAAEVYPVPLPTTESKD